MSLPSLLRRFALAAALGLAAGGAVAADKLYEGLLLPEDFAGPIQVNIELRDLHGVLVGRVKAGSPLSSAGAVSSGEMNGDKCDFQSTLSSGIVLRFVGSCQPGLFEGRYSQPGRRDGASRGTFRLLRKEPEKEEDTSAASQQPLSSISVTECISANTRCLIGCPQGDYNTEFLCSNRCRSRFKTCKSKAAK